MKSKKLHKTLKRVIGFFLLFVFVFTATSMIFSVVVFGILFHRVDSLDNYVEITYSLAKPDYKREKISFASGDNTLSGYVYSAQKPKGLVIIAPGMNSNSDSHLAEIMCFADHGYMSLAYDATGVCESEKLNHERAWAKLDKKITQGKPYNYYPRGRVEIKKGKARIFLNPALNEESIIEKICRSFGLKRENGLTDILIKNDNSWHYRFLMEQ